MNPLMDILIPTYKRPAALAVTLTSLVGQTFHDFRVIVSDQTQEFDVEKAGEVQAVLRVLLVHGHPVQVYKHLPPRGMAEQRQFLLDQARAPYSLFLDDDLILEPYVVGQMFQAIQEEACGFVGSAVIGLTFLEDIRPKEQKIEFWEGKVQPEEIVPGSPEWQRHKLHNAANLYHVQQQLGLTPEKTRKYRVAWVGACVLYDTAKLRAAGGYKFWRDLPVQHSGEDVEVQLRMMRRYGGCGIIPSGVYHQELPTTIEDRTFDAPHILRSFALAEK